MCMHTSGVGTMHTYNVMHTMNTLVSCLTKLLIAVELHIMTGFLLDINLLYYEYLPWFCGHPHRVVQSSLAPEDPAFSLLGQRQPDPVSFSATERMSVLLAVSLTGKYT